MRKWRRRGKSQAPERNDEPPVEPRHSHIRELALPALKSVARFLSLESYRSLPKHDRLPDLSLDEPDDALSLVEPLSDEPFIDSFDERPAEISSRAPEVHDIPLDWDELDVEELAPTPYRRYLFDLLIQSYLEQTRQELSPLLLENDL